MDFGRGRNAEGTRLQAAARELGGAAGVGLIRNTTSWLGNHKSMWLNYITPWFSPL